MRIIYFHQHFSTPKGATGIRSYQMAKALVDYGHQVTMVCGSYAGGSTGLNGEFTNGKRTGSIDGIDIIEFDLAYANSDGFIKRSYLFLKFAVRSMTLALTGKYDVIFATTTPLTAGLPGIVARWFRGKPFVFEVRDLWPELPKAMKVITNPFIIMMLSFLEWLSYKSAHRCIGLSPGIAQGIFARGVSAKNIKVIPNGCDLSIFGAESQPWRPAQVNSSDFMAIFTGTHGLANGLDAIIDVALELRSRQRDDIKLVLIGQGKCKPQLMSQAKELALNNVIFHDPVDKEKLSGLLASADLGLQLLANVPAFYYGTSPNKFFDYIAAGLPVLNNYPGWLAEIIEEANCGFLVPPGNPVAFAEQLEKAADDSLSLPVLGRNSRTLAERKFDRNELAKQWVEWVTGVKDEANF